MLHDLMSAMCRHKATTAAAPAPALAATPHRHTHIMPTSLLMRAWALLLLV
jgi:hypothetical protein